jgi:hypothetical protein
LLRAGLQYACLSDVIPHPRGPVPTHPGILERLR